MWYKKSNLQYFLSKKHAAYKKSGKILLHEPLFVLLKKLLYVSTLFSLHNTTMKMHIFSLVIKIYFHHEGDLFSS